MAREKDAADAEAGALQERDGLQKQIAAFEKLLQHAMNRFSRDKLFNMLKMLSRHLVSAQQLEADAAVHITSIEHLKSVIAALAESHVGQQTVREDEKLLVHYFTAFFQDLEYLNQLKRYFDEKIYVYLYEYFYDPLDDLQGTQDLATSTDTQKSESTESNNNGISEKSRDTPIVAASPHPLSENESKREESQLGEEEIIFDFLSKQAKLSHAVQKMFKVNQKWGNIMDESNPHLGSYDPDSKYELVSFQGSARYEPVLRLLPDIFVKAYKSIEMAKLWWAQANRLYSGKPLQKRGLKEIKKAEVEIEHHIEKITEDIKRFEDTILVRSEDLTKLSERETRFQVLSEQCEKLEERKDKATQAYNAILKQVQSMTSDLDLYQKGTKKYTELEKRLKDKDKQLSLTQDELKILAFHFHIVQEDFSLQMELQPHLLRFKADIESKITDIEEELKVKQGEKRETEKRLVLLKANCEKMHEIMQRYGVLEEEEPLSAPASRENTREMKQPAGATRAKATVNKQKTVQESKSVKKSSSQSKPERTKPKPQPDTKASKPIKAK